MAKPNIETGPGGDKLDENEPLPQFRKDLQVMKGPPEPDGSPTFNLYDPVRSRYYRLLWYEAAILEILRPGMTMQGLIKALKKRTAIDVSARDLEMFFYDAKLHNLLIKNHSSEALSEEAESKTMNPLMWLLFHYMYLRIPLFDPDAFLERTLKYVRPLASKPAVIAYLAIIISGFLMLMTRLEEFFGTFTYFFNWEGILAYAVVILFLKVFHELGHAYTAKNYGIHIPVMGVALIILWPVMYTDASDVWKLESRRKRFAISIAGISVELVIAGIATWGWLLSSPGIFQSIWFLLASVSWVTSLFINLNPCMRFDGYYILSDLWGVDNLQNRSFDVARWKLREWLLGLNAPPPEVVSDRRLAGMVIYSIATWIYRIFLYLGIAVIIYYKFTKVLGIILFATSLIMFFVLPLWGELVSIIKLRRMIKVNLRLMATIIVVTALAVWFVFPMPQTLSFPAVAVADVNQNVYIPEDGKVEEIYVKRGDRVTKGDRLLVMSSEVLNAEIRAVLLDIEVVKRELKNASLTGDARAVIAPKRAELKALDSKLRALSQQRNSLIVKATVDGTIYDWDDDVTVGQSLKQDYMIGRIAQLQDMKVVAYVPEDDIASLEIGSSATFILNSNFSHLSGIIEQIRTGRNVTLEHRQLSSVFGGDLPTKQAKNRKDLQLVESYYIVDIKLENPPEGITIGQLGYVEVAGPWRSRLLETIRLVERVFYRESGL